MSRDKLDFLMPTKFEAADVFRLATVTMINPLQVRVDGDDTALTASPFKLYHPYVGDRVLLQIHGKTPIVIGKLSPGPDLISQLGTENLDSVTKTGVYFQQYNANSTLARNYPVTYAGMLEVFSPNSNNQFIYQRYTTYSNHGAAVYTRGQYNGGSWSTWNIVGGPDTGWITSGLSIGSGGSFTVTGYRLRRRNGQVFGHVEATIGTSVAFGSTGNITDINGVLYMPAGWGNSGPAQYNVDVDVPGVLRAFGRIGNGTNRVDLTHGLPGTTISSGSTLRFNFNYLLD